MSVRKKNKIGRPDATIYRMTQTEVGKKLGICRQVVDRIEKRALRKVRDYILKEEVQ